MNKIAIKVFFFITILKVNIISQIYIAPYGNDSNPGTIDKPLESLQKAQELVNPGDTVFIRGGLYKIRANQISKVVSNLFACVTYLDKSGTEGNTIKYWAYPGETPVFDFSDVKPANQRVVGIYVIGNYIHLKGLEMTGVQVTITGHTESYCIYSRGNHNIFENISMHDNIGTGLRHYKGGYNLFLNCDAFRNWDNVSEDKLGSNTDGFGCHPDAGGKGNIFKGCRAWFNSDDGFDIIRADESVVFDSCWSFYNGYSTSFERLGDGNGFKAGGYAHDTADKIPNPVPRNIIKFCIAVGNKTNGFYSNHHLSGNEWYNNTAYQNDINFNMVNRESPQIDNIWFNGYDHILINNLSYQPVNSHTAYIDNTKNTLSHNSFDLGLNISDNDFISLDVSQLTAPRKPDGSLPDINFMRPSKNSSLIDAGLDVGFNFTGKAPDIGALENQNLTSINYIKNNIPDEIELLQNYPNPFNAFTNFVFKIPYSTHVNIIIYNSLGQKITTLVDEIKNKGIHTVRFDGKNLPSGVYFCKLEVNGITMIKQFVLLK
ncbi:MAG: T9SS type A sorting domain-containing protein [Melioribacter sp.]|uniref:right-handed parallel beta-helix repeat-containing protein n=1 Tax=Rosettibacter primus TaxID=3111523 RepID=UPI00247DDE5A|nr:T9SS type A sorting domain-containing protein [Melioribacter sp.]